MPASVHSVRRRSLAAIVAAGVGALALTLSVTTAAYAAVLYTADFEGGSTSGWVKSGGSWATATDGSTVFRQSSTGSDAKAQAGSTAWAAQSVQARVKPLSFNGSQRFVGVTARSQSMTSYYVLALSNAGQVLLSRRTSGGHTNLATAPATVMPGTWYTLRLTAIGSDLRGYVNGALLVSATDAALPTGRAGLATFYASASFDDILVTDDGAVTPGPTTTTPGPTATSSPTPTVGPTTPPPPPPAGQPDGYASVNALGINGTTGGAGGQTVTVTSAAQLAQYASAAAPYVILVSGRIQTSDMVTVVANKSIIGLGSTAEITGGGLQLGTTTRPGHNVIIRNITFRDASDDSVSVHNGSHHVWIDHNEFYPGFDGSVDVKRQSSFVTVSWNRFHQTDKSMLLGHSDSFTDDIGFLKVTYHHNLFDGSTQRHPRVRFGEPVHVYNNYYRGVGLYGVASTENAGVLVEGNYFEDTAYPCYSAGGYADSAPGRLVERGNIFVRSGVCETNGTVAEPGGFYAYRLDAAATVPGAVTAGAGVGRIPG